MCYDMQRGINMKKEKHIYLFLLIVALQSIGANLAHPVTPTLITDLQLPDYCFGLFFAGMAFTNFLFSPMWAKLVSKFGSKKILLICCSGYSVGQAMFAMFRTVSTIMIARLVSGFFVGGILVSYLSYIVFISDESTRGKNLAYLATSTTVLGTFGYFIGGLLGGYSIFSAFVAQVIVLFISGIIFYCILEDDHDDSVRFNFIRDVNPFKAFYIGKEFVSLPYLLLFSCVFLTSMASTGFDQTFNYYIKDVFGFSTSYNGIIKAAIGVLSFIVNTTVCIWLFKHTDTKKSTMYVLLGCSTTIFFSVCVSSIPFFIILTLLFFAFNALYIPLLQDLCVKNDSGSQLIGMYNAIKSLGMIVGALYAGFVYGIYVKLPFIIAAILFLFALVILQIYKKKV